MSGCVCVCNACHGLNLCTVISMPTSPFAQTQHTPVQCSSPLWGGVVAKDAGLRVGDLALGVGVVEADPRVE